MYLRCWLRDSIELKIVFLYFTGYMVFGRYGFDEGEVDARVDLEVVKLIVEGASEDDKMIFDCTYLFSMYYVLYCTPYSTS